jgi:hypothetical protein
MKPSTSVTSPLEKEDHPELDTSEQCDTDQIAQYQSIIGVLQWIVTVGRFDINTAVMTMSGLRMAPRIGHLNRLRRIYGYLSKMRYASIRIRTEEPDYSDRIDNAYNWTYSAYGNVTELLPTDAPEPLGNYVTLSHYVDANLMHDVTTGRSVTEILHLAKKHPLNGIPKNKQQWKQQLMVQNLLGVPSRDKRFIFRDNKSVVESPCSSMLSFTKTYNVVFPLCERGYCCWYCYLLFPIRR